MTTKYLITAFLFLVTCFPIISCKKYLEAKPDQSLSAPSTLDDLQAILDNPQLNTGLNLSNVGSDEYYLLEQDWLAISEAQNKAYIWAADLDNIEDWANQFSNVFYANTVLDNLPNISVGIQVEKRNYVQAQALFHRAHCFFNLSQLFSKPYNSATANTDLGIPLRLNSNFNEISNRATVQQTYNQIIQDLEYALAYLPNTVSVKSRPNKTACLGLLARIYLTMANFAKSRENAEAYLQIQNTLIDYNSLLPAVQLPGFTENPEVLFYISSVNPVNADDSKAFIDSNLFNSFDINDLRKEIFFRDNGNGTYAFKGNYTGTNELFNGIATDEIFLILAESKARLGDFLSGMSDLKLLLDNRYVTGSYVTPNVVNADQALSIILEERKKELIYRGTRWSDLRRLNLDSRFDITLERKLEGQTYTLQPNDLRYTLLIPQEIVLKTQLQQNPR